MKRGNSIRCNFVLRLFQVIVIICALSPLREVHGQTNWHEPAWAGQWQTITAQVWATSHDITITNWLSATNPVVTNDVFLANINATNIPTNAITNAFTYNVSRPLTNGTVTNFSYTVTNVSARIQTNLVFTRQGVVMLDSYYAMEERLSLAGLTNESTRFYLASYDNLLYFKNRLAVMQNEDAFYVSPVTITNLLAATNLSVNSTHESRWFYGTNAGANIFQAAAVGTNFLTYTSRLELFATNSQRHAIETCTVTFATSSPYVITNYVADCCGNMVYVSGTNNQRVTLICTNANMDPGTTLTAYNYQGLRRVLSNMTTVVLPFTMTNQTWAANYDTNVLNSTFPPDFAAVENQALAIAQTNGPNFYTSGNNAFFSHIEADVSLSDLLFGDTNYNMNAIVKFGTQSYARAHSLPMEGNLIFYAAGGPIQEAPIGSFRQVYDGLGSGIPLITNGSTEIVLPFRTNLIGGANTNAPLFAYTTTVSVASWATPDALDTNVPVHNYYGTKGFFVNPPVFIFYPTATTNGFKFR